MKFGYFIFDEGIKVAFEGGFNETDTGLRRSAESSQIKFSYRGVELSKQELEDIINDTDSIWENGTDTVKVRGVSQKTLAVCREISKGFKPTKKMLDEIDGEDPGDENENTEGDSNPIFPEKTWTHQEKAVNEFLDNKRGILEMATGTGKTRTALIIMSILLERGEINSVIIGIDGDDLLAQWVEDIAEFKMNFSDIYPKLDGLVIQKHFTHEGETFKEHQDFAFSPEDSILLISTHQPEALKTTINILGQKAKKTLIIYDEVHTLASPGRIKVLSNSHDAFEYRFGMSATPKKNYDPEGKLNAFLIDEVGEIMDFKFGLKEAIQGGFLCEFDYHVISYDLNDEERKKIQKFFATCKQAEKDKNYEKVERMRINMANVRKLAASKPGLLYDFIKEKKHRIKYLTSTIIFTQEKVQGKIVGSEVLHELGNTSYHIYFKEKNQPKRVLQGYLDELKDGHKDCLIACKKLSEGIDIQGLKNVILLASDRGKLRTIQRVGRCLRIDPDDRNKRATVIDFQQRVEKEDEGFDGDNERVKFLTELAKVKRSKLSKLKGTIK